MLVRDCLFDSNSGRIKLVLYFLLFLMKQGNGSNAFFLCGKQCKVGTNVTSIFYLLLNRMKSFLLRSVL